MTLFEQLVSLNRTHAIQAGAKIERTNEEIIQDMLVSEPLLKEARRELLGLVESGKLPAEIL